MDTTTTKLVEYTEANLLACRCGTCPVESRSDCAHARMAELDRLTGWTVGGGREPAVTTEDAYRQPQGVGSHGTQGPGPDIGTQGQARGDGNLPSSSDIPGLYCSSGEAGCGDLDFEKRCMCPTCSVWQEHDLGAYKYCKDGPAARIG